MATHHKKQIRNRCLFTCKKRNIYSTNCDQLTPWMRSTEPKCLHPDEVKHSHILRENRDIWSCLHPYTTIFWHTGLPLFCCDFLQENYSIMQLYMLPRPWHGLVLMQPPFQHGLPSFATVVLGRFLSTAFHSVLLKVFILREVIQSR